MSVDSVESDDGIDLGWRSDGASRYLEAAKAALAATPPTPDVASAQAKDALKVSPMNVSALDVLADAANAQGDATAVGTYRNLILRRTVRDLDSLRWEIDELLKQKNYQQLVLTADALLRIDSKQSYGRYAIGVLVLLTQVDEARSLLLDRLRLGPSWGRPFLNALATYGDVDMFPTMMGELNSGVPERVDVGWAPYMDRLMKTGDSRKAYATFAALLPPDQLTELGYVFNGSFESAPSGLLFDWNLVPTRGVDIGIVSDQAADGQNSLSVTFGGAPTAFQNVRETLILDPGDYHLSGMVKTQDLKTERGLTWRIYCFGGNRSGLLAQSPFFSGTSDWSPFKVAFTVPATGCDYQSLQLELPARIAAERQIKGQIWVDKLEIQSDLMQTTVTPPPNG